MVGEAGTDPNSIWIGGGSVGYVAQITREGGLTDEDWRRAALLSAAPELLAALQAIMDDPDAVDHILHLDAVAADAAIAKATGGDL